MRDKTILQNPKSKIQNYPFPVPQNYLDRPLKTGICQSTWKVERFYEGMKIGGAIGLSEAQKATLKALGAVEEEVL